MMSFVKYPHPQAKNFFQVQTRRLAVSFEPLNSSIPLSAPELYARKATCDPVVWRENPQNRPDAKVLSKIKSEGGFVARL